MATEPISSLGLKNWGPKLRQNWPDYWPDVAWLAGFVVLPFASYLSLGILAVLSVISWVQQRGRLSGWLWQQGYGMLSVGLLLSAAVAAYPGDAFLQTANFLPYFLMLGALVSHYSRQSLAVRVAKLQALASALVITSFPFSALALIEYLVKFPAIAAQVSDWSLFRWAFDVSYVGHRANATLGHPNILSAYLVIVMSLGLGLLGISLNQAKVDLQRLSILGFLTLADLVGIFCTGSRNGLLIAVLQLFIFAAYLQKRRSIRLVGIGLVSLLLLGVASLGVGGRELAVGLMTRDPRVDIWQIAFQLIQQRPWLGWGLGGFGHLYIPHSVPEHEHVHHAHNLWLYLASEVGIPMMIGFCWVVGRAMYRAVRTALDAQTLATHRAILISYLMAFGSCMSFGLFDVPLFDARINVLGWLILGALYLMCPQMRSQISEAEGSNATLNPSSH